MFNKILLSITLVALTTTSIHPDACWTPGTQTCWEHIEMDETKCAAMGYGAKSVMGCFISHVAKFKYECESPDGSLPTQFWTKQWSLAAAKKQCRETGGVFRKLK